MEAPVLETERLRLRGHRAEDLSACAAMWSEEGVTQFIGGRPLTEEESWSRMLRHAGHWGLLRFGYWVVEERGTGRFLGEAGLAEWRRVITPSIAGRREAGWVFAAAAQGKGYAYEAMRAVLAWGEARFGDGRSVCLIAPGNAASWKLAAKLGYVEERRAMFHGEETVVLGR